MSDKLECEECGVVLDSDNMGHIVHNSNGVKTALCKECHTPTPPMSGLKKTCSGGYTEIKNLPGG